MPKQDRLVAVEIEVELCNAADPTGPVRGSITREMSYYIRKPALENAGDTKSLYIAALEELIHELQKAKEEMAEELGELEDGLV
jgi:hypothetical protein